VCGSFWRVDKIQNGGRCHGNQGAKIVKFIPNTGRTGNANLLIGGKISIGAQVTESHKIESPPPCFMVLFRSITVGLCP
jgi:hypothetical protein